jgi:Tfp pilus assembly protein PilN
MPYSAIGVEVGPTRLRALRLGSRGRIEAMEVAWAPRPPLDSIAALRERFGSRNVVAAALDMSGIFVKRLQLPPLSMEERRRIVATDPQRYFPVLDDTLVAGVRDDDLVVAARAEPFDTWAEALGALGSVERMEPSPVALVRHLAAHGIEDGLLVMADPGSPEAILARFQQRRIGALRKLPSGVGELSELVVTAYPPVRACALHPWREDLAGELGRRLPPGTVVPVPAPPGAPDSFAVAHGAALGLDGGAELTLVSPALARRTSAAIRRRALVHIAVLVAALGFLGWSLDHRRTATLRALDARIAALHEEATPVLELRDRAASIAAEVAVVSVEASARANPLDVLLALTRLLPADAYVTQLSVSGEQWELVGLARDAAQLVPLLERSELFADVRFRTATTRVRIRDESFENFSLVFRRVPAT